MKNANYWRGRFSILKDRAHQEADQYIQSLEEIFKDAQRTIQADIERWYGRFAANNGISLTEARKLLTAGQLEEFKWTVDQYIKIGEQAGLSDEWMKKLENASAKFHVSRLEALQTQIQQQMELLYGNQFDGIDRLLIKIAGDGYTQTAYTIHKGIGLGWDITALDQKKLRTLLLRPWTTDGRTFSDRIWIKKNELIASVQKELTQGLLRGDSSQKITDAIQKRFNVSRYQAGRLVHTETTYFNAVSTKQAYQDLGVEKIEVLETLDSRTCEICGSLDGTVIPISQYEPGVTVPPFHPNCVLPDTFIASPDGEAIIRGEYSGEVVEFITANGRRLGVTPNHIMLTSRGWVRAKNLVQGDQVIYYCGWDKLIVESDPAHDNRVPAVEQLFTSFLKSYAVPPIGVPTTAEDLKGDAVENGKVDIIFIDSLLRSKLDSSVGKLFSDLPLIWAGKIGEVLLSGNCSLAQFLMGIGFASDGIMGGLDIAGILIRGSLAHHELIRLRGGTHYNARLRKTALDNGFSNRKLSGNFVNAAAGIIQSDDFIQRERLSGVGLPDGDSSFIQNTNDGLSCTAKDICDFCNAFPGVVEFDNIISVDRRLFTGHVYDISSQSTLYLCNGFLSSNCRGTTCPHFDDMDGERAARNADGEVYYVPSNMTYTQWKKAFVDGGVKDSLTLAEICVDGALGKSSRKNYVDAMEEWCAKATPNSHDVKDLQSYTVNGVTYTVDGHNVVLDYSDHEKEIAELLKQEFGGEIFMVPRVNNPQGVSTSDYLFRGIAYDLKTLEKKEPGKNPIFNRINKSKDQASNFIIDVTKSSISDSVIESQLEKIFQDKGTRFVQEIIIVRDGKIIRVVKRA